MRSARPSALPLRTCSAGRKMAVAIAAPRIITRETGKSGLTLREFGNAKGFDPEWLAGHGIHEEKNALVFRYLTMDGQKAARQRLRLALEASGNSKKFIWSNRSGRPTVFGLWLLNGWLKAGLRDLYLVEGESDSLTLWRHGMAALGIPGADMCGKLAAPHIRGFSRIFVVKEADEGGETFVKGMTGQLGKLGFRGQAAVIQMTIMGVKDTNALHVKTLKDPGAFAAAWACLVADAQPLNLPILGLQVRWTDTIEAQQVSWLWYHRVPRGKLALLVGPPGVGKSYLSLDLAARLSTGRLGLTAHATSTPAAP